MEEEIRVQVEYDFDRERGEYIADIRLYLILNNEKRDLLDSLPHVEFFNIPITETANKAEMEIGRQIYRETLKKYSSFPEFREGIQRRILALIDEEILLRRRRKPKLRDVYHFLV